MSSRLLRHQSGETDEGYNEMKILNSYPNLEGNTHHKYTRHKTNLSDRTIMKLGLCFHFSRLGQSHQTDTTACLKTITN